MSKVELGGGNKREKNVSKHVVAPNGAKREPSPTIRKKKEEEKRYRERAQKVGRGKKSNFAEVKCRKISFH